MFTMIQDNSRRFVSAFAAVMFTAVTVAGIDPGPHASTPRGVVELGELVPVEQGASQLAATAEALLPEVVVTASRLEAQPVMFAGELPRLPELVIVGRRDVAVAATAPARAGTQG